MAEPSLAFFQAEIRVGTITQVDPFPQAHKPAYKLTIDFGPEIGTLRSSAQITDLYTPQDLLNTQIIAVTNLPPKQIGPFMSQCLVTGFPDHQNRIILARPDHPTPNGTQLC